LNVRALVFVLGRTVSLPFSSYERWDFPAHGEKANNRAIGSAIDRAMSISLGAHMPRFHQRSAAILLTFAVFFVAAPSEATPILNVDNGHYYELITSAGVAWTTARDGAAASTFLAMGGYLATITSASEENFVEGLLPNAPDLNNYYLGGSDSAVEGVWRWVTGPEAGTQFWQGGKTGSPVNGAYEDWERSSGVPRQPDNAASGVGEDFLAIEIYSPNDSLKSWNDNTGNARENGVGYIVEYSPVPEPGTLVLVGGSLVGLAARARKRRRD
jgi:PEP-CTERM motif